MFSLSQLTIHIASCGPRTLRLFKDKVRGPLPPGRQGCPRTLRRFPDARRAGWAGEGAQGPGRFPTFQSPPALPDAHGSRGPSPRVKKGAARRHPRRRPAAIHGTSSAPRVWEAAGWPGPSPAQPAPARSPGGGGAPTPGHLPSGRSRPSGTPERGGRTRRTASSPSADARPRGQKEARPVTPGELGPITAHPACGRGLRAAYPAAGPGWCPSDVGPGPYRLFGRVMLPLGRERRCLGVRARGGCGGRFLPGRDAAAGLLHLPRWGLRSDRQGFCPTLYPLFSAVSLSS